MDFTSLYPSIIIYLGICLTQFVKVTDTRPDDYKKYYEICVQDKSYENVKYIYMKKEAKGFINALV